MKAIKLIILTIWVLSITPTSYSQWSQMGVDIDGSLGEWTGAALSMSNDGLTMAVGGGNGDVVRVYKWTAGAWVQQGADLVGDGDFGMSVGLSDDGLTLVVGANYNNDAFTQAGQVQVYQFVAGSWVQVGADIDGQASGDQCGWSSSINSDGTSIAIGSWQSDMYGTNKGHVRVFKLITGNWTQVGADIQGEANSDISGASVSISDDGLTVAIGANGNDVGGSQGNNIGHVRVFEFVAGSWVQKGADMDGEAIDDHSGYNMEMSGDGSTVVIGGRRNDGNGSNAGHVRVYKYITGTWTQLGADIDGEAAGDQFGTDVDISDDGLTIIAGAMLNDGNGNYAGHARVYEYASGVWTQVGADIDGEAAEDQAGFAVCISSDGTIIGVGAHKNSEVGIYAGHVRVYSTCVASAPTPDLGSLPDINGECSVSTPTAPTASSCVGTFNGTPDVTFPITSQGTTMVTWTYNDGSGNTSTQTQNVVIADVTAPVPDVATLTDVTDECTVSSLTPPTATDNCATSVAVTNDATLPITAQGTTIVTWTYDDGNGNTTDQTQNIVITDATTPVADVANLSDINSECEVTPTAPTATDNCSGAVTATPDVTFPITASGTTTITWTYDDGNGNTATQTQDVIITPIDNGITQVDATTLSADATGYTYQWVDCDDLNAPVAGATNQTFTPTVAGNYACEVSNGTCTVTTACLSATVGITENDFGADFIVYPNPTADGNVQIIVESEIKSISLFDLSGKELTINANLNQKTINCSSLEAGSYIVKLILVNEIILKSTLIIIQ